MDNKCGCCGMSLFFIDDRCPNCLPEICRVAEEPSEEEKNVFFASIAAEEKRKLDAHDDLLAALIAIERTAGIAATYDDPARVKARKAIQKATGVQQ